MGAGARLNRQLEVPVALLAGLGVVRGRHPILQHARVLGRAEDVLGPGPALGTTPIGGPRHGAYRAGMNMPVNHGRVRPPRITAYTDWLARQRGLHFGSYDELWHWSVSDLPAFWQSLWDFFEVESGNRIFKRHVFAPAGKDPLALGWSTGVFRPGRAHAEQRQARRLASKRLLARVNPHYSQPLTSLYPRRAQPLSEARGAGPQSGSLLLVRQHGSDET